MIKKILVYTLLFFIPLEYLPLILTAFFPRNGFIFILLFALICGVTLSLVNPIFEFLTLKQNAIIKIIATAIFMYAALYLSVSIFKLAYIGVGGINLYGIKELHFLLPYITHWSQPINMIATSLLLAIWGIIIKILIN